MTENADKLSRTMSRKRTEMGRGHHRIERGVCFFEIKEIGLCTKGRKSMKRKVMKTRREEFDGQVIRE